MSCGVEIALPGVCLCVCFQECVCQWVCIWNKHSKVWRLFAQAVTVQFLFSAPHVLSAKK